jgi:hypothetical protein
MKNRKEEMKLTGKGMCNNEKTKQPVQEETWN